MATKRDGVAVLQRLYDGHLGKLSDARETYEVISNLMGVIDNPQELASLLWKHLRPKAIEKKQNGEVFTPPELVNKMLAKLPPEIWSNHAIRFLDTSNGIGNFPAIAYQLLMVGLKNVIPGAAARKKHILEKQLYMVELTLLNVEIARKLFDPKGIYDLNLHQGNFLDFDPKIHWGIDKFDVVFGNPPYNAPGKGASGNTIWQHFVRKSMTLINPDGYLVFVHPPGWRKPNTPKGKFNGLFKDMCQDNTLVYLDINDSKKGNETFHCGTRYDWYVIKMTKPNGTLTTIRDERDQILTCDLSSYKWLPNAMIDLMNQILNNGSEACHIIQSMSAYEPRKKWMSKTQTPVFRYPCVHATNKGETRFMWSNTKGNGHFGVSKVIFGDSGINEPIIDLEGKYGMTQHAMAIQVSNLQEAELIVKALKSDKFKTFLKSCIWSSFAIEWNMFSDFKRTFYKSFVDCPEDLEFPALSPAPVDVIVSQVVDYSKMTITDLKQLCKDKKIKGVSGKKKDELITMLKS